MDSSPTQELKPTSPIEDSMRKLATTIDGIDDKVSRLKNRLSPVLGNEVPRGETPEKAVEASDLGKLNNKLTAANRFAQNILYKLNDMLERLQI